MQRRQFLSTLASTTALCTFEALSAGCSATPTSPSVTAGSNARTVRTFGAMGDGVTDDTAAFAAAVREVGASGGVLVVPAGIYRINPLQAVALTSGVHLSLSPGAVLQAIPVVEGQSAVVTIRNVSDVKVTGGTVVGERTGHRGSTGEWGFGIDVRGSANVTIENVVTRDCWGDGIYVGAGAAGESRNVTVRGCTGTGHRRQGLSITALLTGLVERCEFTGIQGTVPQAGIDLEPNAPYAVRNVTVRNNVTTGNSGGGIIVQGETTSDCVIENNECSRNGHYGGIAVMLGATRCEIRGNLVEWNERQGIHLLHVSGNLVTANTVRHNSQGRSRQWPNLWLQSGSRGNLVKANMFADPANAPTIYPNFDILVEADCDGNRITGNTLRVRRPDPSGAAPGGVENLNPTTEVDD